MWRKCAARCGAACGACGRVTKIIQSSWSLLAPTPPPPPRARTQCGKTCGTSGGYLGNTDMPSRRPQNHRPLRSLLIIMVNPKLTPRTSNIILPCCRHIYPPTRPAAHRHCTRTQTFRLPYLICCKPITSGNNSNYTPGNLQSAVVRTHTIHRAQSEGPRMRKHQRASTKSQNEIFLASRLHQYILANMFICEEIPFPFGAMICESSKNPLNEKVENSRNLIIFSVLGSLNHEQMNF